MDKYKTCQPCAQAKAQYADACTLNLGNQPLDQLPLAMAYVPMQSWTTTYELDTALEKGTIFPDLDLPFLGRGGINPCK